MSVGILYEARGEVLKSAFCAFQQVALCGRPLMSPSLFTRVLTSSHIYSLSTLSEPRRSKPLHGSTGVLHTPFLRVNHRFLLIPELRNLWKSRMSWYLLDQAVCIAGAKEREGQKRNPAFAIYIVLTLRARCRVHGDIYETRQQENQ